MLRSNEDRVRSYAALKLHKKAFDRENLRWSREDENRLPHWRLSRPISRPPTVASRGTDRGASGRMDSDH